MKPKYEYFRPSCFWGNLDALKSKVSERIEAKARGLGGKVWQEHISFVKLPILDQIIIEAENAK